ncbi:MAG: hypothetical protein KAI72_06070 [Candidatus Pacebacteria bacterium]|nr:hypothetical protein [Candidatus Paceibacterota bacterium]
MNIKENVKEALIIVLVAIVLALAVGYKEQSIIYAALASFLIILGVNVLVKKAVGYHFETAVRTKLWTWYQFGLRTDMHFKKPIPMIWLPLILTLFTKGFFLWLGILEFDVVAKTERVAKRHGLYRFSEVTEWHMAWIAIWAIAANLILAIIGYVAGFELSTKLSIYFIFWSTLPIARLDGSKIFYASKGLWAVIFTVATILLIWSLRII